MDQRCDKGSLVLSALSAILMATLIAMYSVEAISAETAPASADAASAGHSPNPISDVQFQKIIALIGSSQGHSIDLNSELVSAFGLNKDGSIVTVRSFAVKTKKGVLYEISRLDGDKGYMIARRTETMTRAFMVNTQLSLVSGLTFKRGQVPVIMRIKEAQAAFNEDLAVWAKIADSFPPAQVPPTK